MIESILLLIGFILLTVSLITLFSKCTVNYIFEKTLAILGVICSVIIIYYMFKITVFAGYI